MNAIDFRNLSKKSNVWTPFKIKNGKCDLPNGYYELDSYDKNGSYYLGSCHDGIGLLVLDYIPFYTYPDRPPVQAKFTSEGMCRKVGNYRIEIQLDANA